MWSIGDRYDENANVFVVEIEEMNPGFLGNRLGFLKLNKTVTTEI